MHNLFSRSGAAVVIGLLCTGSPVRAAHAESYAFGAGYFGEYSDNIRRAPTEPQPEWIDSVIAGIAYSQDGPTLDAHILAQAEYPNFRNDSYVEKPDYYTDTSLLWRIAPQQLHWLLANRYSQMTRDATRPDTPDNRVNANVLSTGPDLYIRFGQVNALELGARFGRAMFSEDDIDSRRYGAVARWMHVTSTDTTHSLNYEVEQIRYDNEVANENLRKQDTFVRLDKHQIHSNLQLDIGVTRLARDRTGDTSGYLVRMKTVQQRTSISSVGLTLAGEYLDAGNVLLATNSGADSAAGGSTAIGTTGGTTNDYFYTKRIEGYYRRGDDRNGLDARAYFRDIDYDISLQDRREFGGRIDATHYLNSLLAAAAYGSHIRTKYLNNPREDRENEVGIRLLYRIDKNYTTTLEARRTWRYSTDAFQEYTDNRILVSLVFSSGPLFSPGKELTGDRARPSFQMQEFSPLVTPQ